jgi:branched-chain amino acid transport system ATP-binding protein
VRQSARPRRQIVFDGRDITQLPTHEIARLKLAQSPEGRRIFRA